MTRLVQIQVEVPDDFTAMQMRLGVSALPLDTVARLSAEEYIRKLASVFGSNGFASGTTHTGVGKWEW